MLLAMSLSIIFCIIDICSVTETLKSALPVGINPFWKLAFVFKLLTDSVILDDFKTALDKLCAFNLSRAEEGSGDGWPRHDVGRPKHNLKNKLTGGVAENREDIELRDGHIQVKTETKFESVEMAGAGQPNPIVVSGARGA
jgi:hypothetical protein